jgi:hypothetical protein
MLLVLIKNQRKLRKEINCCSKEEEKSCTKEMREAAKREGKICCDKKKND